VTGSACIERIQGRTAGDIRLIPGIRGKLDKSESSTQLGNHPIRWVQQLKQISPSPAGHSSNRNDPSCSRPVSRHNHSIALARV
jgi:hypothetical protein